MKSEKATILILEYQRMKRSGYQYDDPGTGEKLGNILQRVRVLEESLEEVKESLREKASPENLYQAVVPSPIPVGEYPLILKIHAVLSEGLEQLQRSLDEQDELLRESYIDLYFNNIRRLHFIQFQILISKIH